jgi:hypothetical protein
MTWLPFVSRRRYLRALNAEQAETLRVKKTKDEWWQRHDAVAEELAAVSIVNACLTEDLTAAREQLKQHAGQLEANLTTASLEEIEAWEARVKAHLAWTPPTDREARPVDGASGRPTHPATDLRRALERCRALQALLDQRGKRVAS